MSVPKLNDRHEREWLNSAVDPQIIALNVISLEGLTPLEYLLYALPQSERRNDGRLREKYLRQYAHTEKGGAWIFGRDPHNNWQFMEWGRFKPDFPRQGWDKETQRLADKKVKYESPTRTENRLTYLGIPLSVWQAIAKNCGVAMPENIVVTPEGEALGFWAWVQANPCIPIVLTEGEKKAACLLSMGIVAIGLPGIWGGRVGKGETEQLHPDIVPIAQEGREFTILFDYETKPKTKLDIYRATYRTGWAIQRHGGCRCTVALLPGQEKGVDDWVFALGKKAPAAVAALLGDARTISEYQQQFWLNRSRGLHKHKPTVRVTTRYLSDAIVKLPASGLVCLLSDMGTGKTELLARWRQEHPDETFLNNGHRVNLLKNLAERLKTTMYSALNSSELGNAKALSITVDSLYKIANNLQAYGCVFIDEACQYVVHLLKSKTCRNHRATILEVLETVVHRAKLVVLADAHLDDVTINFFLAMRSPGEEPFIIQNHWKSGGREVSWYEGSNSSRLVSEIHRQVLLGKKLMIVSDSKRFIKKVERSLNVLDDARTGRDEEDTPEPEEDRRLRVWAIHAENSGSEENSLFIREINDAVTTIDVLLASPSLGTGVDIKTPHFDVIFGAFHAVSQSANECAQQLWRVRPNVPMHVWVAERPPFGYLETNPHRIKERYLQMNEMTAFLIGNDRETGRRGAEKDWALDACCEIEAQRNASVNNLRQDLRALLEEMSNIILPMGEEIDESAKNLMKAAGRSLDQEHCHAVTKASDVDRKTYETRQRQDYLKPEETIECEKFRIKDAYGMEITPKLVEKDDGGRLLRKLKELEAILAPPGDIILDAHGQEIVSPPQIVVDKDKYERDTLGICTDWANHSVYWLLLHILGMRDILLALMAGDEVSNASESLQALAKRAQGSRHHIKQILNLTIPCDASPIWILGQLLQLLGLSTVSRRIGTEGGGRERIYRLNAITLDFAKEVLLYRQKQREEKERKQRLEQEFAARRAAGINSQYGSQAPPLPASTPAPFIKEESYQGGCGQETNQEALLGEKSGGWVTQYTRRIRTALAYGLGAVKSLLGVLAIEEMWEVAFAWEAENLEEFSQFTELAPDWFRWCRA